VYLDARVHLGQELIEDLPGVGEVRDGLHVVQDLRPDVHHANHVPQVRLHRQQETLDVLAGASHKMAVGARAGEQFETKRAYNERGLWNRTRSARGDTQGGLRKN
jgi:hypothetical protein